MADPLFSIILPTYNRMRMARTAIETVRLQSFTDWECLVVDDGSTDDTPGMLREFKDDPRVRSMRLDKNSGMNAARNYAVERARGRFVTFLDSDDLWLPQRLEAFSRRLDQSPEAGFLFSNAYILRYGRIVGMVFDPGRDIPEGVVPGDYAIGERHLPYVTTNVAVLREGFKRFGDFKTRLTTDTDLWARFIAGGLPVAVIRDAVSVRRLHGEQLSSKYVGNFYELQTALEECGASPEQRKKLREDMCREVATYLVKSAQPGEARAFLLKELGPAAKATPLYRLTFIPAPLLRAVKNIRKTFLMLRHHPLWASSEVRKVYGIIEPLIARETATTGT